MALFCQVKHGPVAIFLVKTLSSHHESRQISLGAPARQDAACAGGETEELLEPVEHEQLDLCRPGRFEPNAGEKVRAGAKEVAEHRRESRRAWNKCQEAGMVDAKGVRRDLS